MHHLSLLIIYKSFKSVCHRGLGISALMAQKVLRQLGVRVHIEAISNEADIDKAIRHHAPTHVQISAPWVSMEKLQKLIYLHSEVKFSVLYHSNFGFLHVDPGATGMLFDLSELQRGSHNFRLCSNSHALWLWLQATINPEAVYLPNLYYLPQTERMLTGRPGKHGNPIKIGAFGAQRALKNHLTAGAAAILLARQLSARVRFYVSSGRAEGGDNTALKRLFHDSLVDLELVEVGWQNWPAFHRTIGQMDICVQPSHTESFNMVTADAASQLVPSVVSPAITWVPERWRANPDDVHAIAARMSDLLYDAHAGAAGYEALRDHVAAAVPRWLQFLGLRPRAGVEDTGSYAALSSVDIPPLFHTPGSYLPIQTT